MWFTANTNNSPHIIFNDKVFNFKHIVNDILGHRKISEARIDDLKKELVKFKSMETKKKGCG